MKDAYYFQPEVSNSDLGTLRDLLYGSFTPGNKEVAYANGNLLDCMITEEHKVDLYKRTCDGITFSQDEMNCAIKMRKSYFKDEYCKSTHGLATFQKVFVREIELDYYGFKFKLPMRCKFDRWFDSMNFGDDIKSTACETEKQCMEALYHFNYDQQRAIYMTLANSEKDMLIFISKKNYKLFKVPITRDCEIFKSGMAKFTEIAFKYYMLCVDFNF